MKTVPTPSYQVDDTRRQDECSRAFDAVARAIMISAVAAGWREGEAALALADAAERYVIYIATPVRAVPAPANTNTNTR